MSQIKININHRPYTVACDDGQEEHLHKLANFLNDRVVDLSNSLGQIGDANLLVMAGLLVSDEMSDAFAEIDQLKQKLAAYEDGASRVDVGMDETGEIVGMTERINEIVAKIEGA